MNILLILGNTGNDQSVYYALVPAEKLEGIDLDALNGKNGQDFQPGNPVGDQIDEIYDRFGLLGEYGRIKDLQPYLNPQAPFTVDKVVMLQLSL